MSFLFCGVDTVFFFLFHITIIIISVVFFFFFSLSLALFFSFADGCVPYQCSYYCYYYYYNSIIPLSEFCFVFLFLFVCRVPYKFYPALTLFVVSFLVGYLHEVVGTLGRKKLYKGKIICGERKRPEKKKGFAFTRAKLFRGRKIGAR